MLPPGQTGRVKDGKELEEHGQWECRPLGVGGKTVGAAQRQK